MKLIYNLVSYIESTLNFYNSFPPFTFKSSSVKTSTAPPGIRPPAPLIFYEI